MSTVHAWISTRERACSWARARTCAGVILRSSRSTPRLFICVRFGLFYRRRVEKASVLRKDLNPQGESGCS